MGSSVGGVLWVTVPGATRAPLVAWMAWVAFAAFGVPLLAERLGPAGAAILVVGIGWILARRIPLPVERLRRYHLDDSEATVIGPGGRVLRLPWEAVERVTQGRLTLTLHGSGIRIAIPMLPLVGRGIWAPVLARVVPELAEDLWARLDEGEKVDLVPGLEPDSRALAWWAWGPAAAAAALGVGPLGLGIAAALALAERGVALARARIGTVTLQRAGVALRSGLRGVFVSWPRVEVMRAAYGLLVGPADGRCGRVRTTLPNYCAAAPVIELRAQLGTSHHAHVSFRARIAEGRLAVVGEVEPSA
jgi:hypothetical protein